MRTLTQNFKTESDKRISENALIVLIELTLLDNTIVYYTNWKSSVSFGGKTYNPIPFEVMGINENKDLDLETVDIRLSNVTRELVDMIKQNNAFIGQQMIIKLTFENLLADSTSFIQDIYWVEKCSVRDTEVLFSLSTKFNVFSLRIPQHKFSRLYCQWQFNKTGCEWSTYGSGGNPNSCDKTLNGANGCATHGNKKRRRAFPGIPLNRIYI